MLALIIHYNLLDKQMLRAETCLLFETAGSVQYCIVNTASFMQYHHVLLFCYI